MSRTLRKKPIIGHCGGSEKQDKRDYNRSFRHRLKQAVKKMLFDLLPERDFNGHHGRNWAFQKDGKSYRGPKAHEEYGILFK
jgi:hypothetical protein